MSGFRFGNSCCSGCPRAKGQEQVVEPHQDAHMVGSHTEDVEEVSLREPSNVRKHSPSGKVDASRDT
jgi:hypothetical protein